jgi:DnaJ-class molecular chaperone
MSRKDPKGYYAILQVDPNASMALIKTAYRHRAMELHPDRNRAPNATAQFQLLTVAFSHIGDAYLRAAYDAQSAVSRKI